MRPIDKGSDLGEFNPYKKAQQSLTERLGEYCSYCERWIASCIHVEHKKPKNDYPEDEFRWCNFLLSCVNCNSSKGSGKLNLDDYLWPDQDNTFLAFIYDLEGRVLPNTIYGNALNQKIIQTWKMLGLNKHPDTSVNGNKTPTDRDKRWLHRRNAWLDAENSKQLLAQYDTLQQREHIVKFACQRGFWSVWMTVFKDDMDMRQRLIAAFKGTSQSCFDVNMQPIHRSGGQI